MLTHLDIKKELKLPAWAESQARVHDERTDFVAANRAEFLKLVAAKWDCSLTDVAKIIGREAEQQGRTFDELLFQSWKSCYYPKVVEWSLTASTLKDLVRAA